MVLVLTGLGFYAIRQLVQDTAPTLMSTVEENI